MKHYINYYTAYKKPEESKGKDALIRLVTQLVNEKQSHHGWVSEGGPHGTVKW